MELDDVGWAGFQLGRELSSAMIVETSLISHFLAATRDRLTRGTLWRLGSALRFLGIVTFFTAGLGLDECMLAAR